MGDRGQKLSEAELEQIDRAIAQSKNIYDLVDGYDLRHIPTGTVGNMQYNVLDFGVATSGVDVGFEYVHSYAGLKGKIDCSSLP